MIKLQQKFRTSYIFLIIAHYLFQTHTDISLVQSAIQTENLEAFKSETTTPVSATDNQSSEDEIRLYTEYMALEMNPVSMIKW